MLFKTYIYAGEHDYGIKKNPKTFPNLSCSTFPSTRYAHNCK